MNATLAHQARLVRSILDLSARWPEHDPRRLLVAILQAKQLPAYVKHNRETPGFRGRILSLETGESHAAKPGEIGRKIVRLCPTPSDREIVSAALSRCRFRTRDGKPRKAAKQ